MQRRTITFDDELMEDLDGVIAAKGYQNRSEAIRDLARAGMKLTSIETGAATQLIGVLSYVFDHCSAGTNPDGKLNTTSLETDTSRAKVSYRQAQPSPRSSTRRSPMQRSRNWAPYQQKNSAGVSDPIWHGTGRAWISTLNRSACWSMRYSCSNARE
jgi:hypothetical protein